MLEQGLVVLSLKYNFQNKSTDSKKITLPQISLIKQNNKICADCICPNLQPAGKDSNPSFWIARDNWIQLVEIDISKPQKIIPAKSIKFEY